MVRERTVRDRSANRGSSTAFSGGCALDGERVIDLHGSSLQAIARYRGRYNGVVVQGDALKFLTAIPSETAGIVFLDPPFNLGKRYPYRSARLDRLPDDRYELWLRAIL